MTALTRADRRSKVEVELAREKAEAEAHQEKQRANAAEQRTLLLEAEIAARDRLLAQLIPQGSHSSRSFT